MNQLNSLKTNHLYQRISNTVIESPLAIRFSLNRVTTQLLLVAVAISLSGCFSMNVWQWGKNGPPQEQQLFQEAQNQPRLENPLTVPVVNRDILWNQIVDTVDDYFRIRREEPIQLVGNTLTEGYIETIATDAATVLEPWRKDGVAGYEQIHATLQSIRRQAEIRVRPVQNGFQIEIIVHKELCHLIAFFWLTINDSSWLTILNVIICNCTVMVDTCHVVIILKLLIPNKSNLTAPKLCKVAALPQLRRIF